MKMQRVGILIADQVDRMDNLLAYIHIQSVKEGARIRDWASHLDSEKAKIIKKNKVQLWGNLFSKKEIEFTSFQKEGEDCPIEKEDRWGKKIPDLQYANIDEDNLLYFENDWVDDNKHPDVDSLEIEFWFFCRSTDPERDLMQVLFLSSQEEVMLGVKKSKVFLKIHQKSRSFFYV